MLTPATVHAMVAHLLTIDHLHFPSTAVGAATAVLQAFSVAPDSRALSTAVRAMLVSPPDGSSSMCCAALCRSVKRSWN
jgi:hypothetical protein